MEITPEYNENSFSVGFNQGQEMTIGNAAHLFSLLSRNLYSNPKIAMFREIITNAWDAHIAANKSDTPIEIKADGNTIIISDFGHGISPKDFMNLYGQVGGSNKRNIKNVLYSCSTGDNKTVTDEYVNVIKSNNNGNIKDKVGAIKSATTFDDVLAKFKKNPSKQTYNDLLEAKRKRKKGWTYLGVDKATQEMFKKFQ